MCLWVDVCVWVSKSKSKWGAVGEKRQQDGEKDLMEYMNWTPVGWIPLKENHHVVKKRDIFSFGGNIEISTHLSFCRDWGFLEMKMKGGSQHVRCCVSVNSDGGEFVYMSVWDDCYTILVWGRGSWEVHPNWDKVRGRMRGWRSVEDHYGSRH